MCFSLSNKFKRVLKPGAFLHQYSLVLWNGGLLWISVLCWFASFHLLVPCCRSVYPHPLLSTDKTWALETVNFEPATFPGNSLIWPPPPSPTFWVLSFQGRALPLFPTMSVRSSGQIGRQIVKRRTFFFFFFCIQSSVPSGEGTWSTWLKHWRWEKRRTFRS